MVESPVRKRDIKLSDYNISRAKYNELKYFCMQYGEKRQELHKNYGLGSVSSDGLPKGNLPGNPTEKTAIRNSILKKRYRFNRANGNGSRFRNLSMAYKKNVTEGIPYEFMPVPLSRTKFYDSRRYFFYLLAQRR